jgi:LmbE family N-acetylglucosaminyl deacetylase
LKFLFAIVLAVSVAGAYAQDATEIGQTLRDLTQVGVLMDVSAHPDDEDGATLAYYRMKHGVHTYSVLFTRGEGGQNEKGSDLYEDLGVIRTAETRSAGRVLGAEVEFLNFPDFGYSKTATEAFHVWGGQQEVLRRLVYIIRRIKPDVIFSNHSTWGGHGQHQAVAITAIAAFDAAADSTMFPEQLREAGISLWQPRKLYLRVFGGSQENADVAHNLEEVNDLRGAAYIDVATNALRMHRTQGLDRADLRAFNRGRSAYRLARASSLFSPDSTDFFGGLRDWEHEPLSSLRPVETVLQQCSQNESWESLVTFSSLAMGLIDSIAITPAGSSPFARRVLHRWRERLEHLSSVAAGVECAPGFQDSILVPGQRMQVTVTPRALRGRVLLQSVSWSLPAGWSARPEAPAEPDKQRVFTLQVGEHPRLSFPRAEHLYRPIEDGDSVKARVVYSLNGRVLSMEAPVAVDVASPHLLRALPDVRWVQPEDLVRGISVVCRVTNMFPHKSAGAVNVAVPAGWKGAGFTFALEKEGATEEGRIQLVGPAHPKDGDYTIHLTTEYAAATVTVRVAGVALPTALRVGLVSSYDTTMGSSLRGLRVRCDTLSDAVLANGDLLPYRTIVVDMRAYLVRDELRKSNGRLLDWVRQGGNLVVMYQREGEWKQEYAPYPFSVSRQRVTMEDAPVTVLLPRHPLLCWPNVITIHDWDGWKQERSVYLPVRVPADYERLVTSHDPDEPEADTGYLCASYGKGSYIYTTYVWYRQLKDGHPGALRCLANMISYPLRAR